LSPRESLNPQRAEDKFWGTAITAIGIEDRISGRRYDISDVSSKPAPLKAAGVRHPKASKCWRFDSLKEQQVGNSTAIPIRTEQFRENRASALD
jgi:hypothetical protein